MNDARKLTKEETVALWHAVTTMEECVRAMREIGCLPEQIEFERARLKIAKRALRKVNVIRRAQS